MGQVHALQQRQQRKRKPLTTAEFAFAEPTQLFAPGAFTSTSLLPSEGQEQPTQVAQFKHAFDQIPINSPVPNYETEQSPMQQAGMQLSPLQRKEADSQQTSQEDAPLQLVARPAPAPGDMVYIVKPGDSLSQIAGNNKTTWQTLAQYNQIADPNLIDPGFQLYIPANEPTGTPDTPQPTTGTPQPTGTPDTPQPTTGTPQPTGTPQTTGTPDTSQPTDTPQSAYTPPANTPQTTTTPAPPTTAPAPQPTTPAPTSDVVPQHNTANLFPYGQCTWWANQRYHDLAGYFVPWTTNSNADQWTARARDFGWHVSDQPSVGAIIDFQAGVQLASDVGHVAIVEQILNDGTLMTSNMNIIGHAFGEVATLKNYAGPGVTFITYK